MAANSQLFDSLALGFLHVLLLPIFFFPYSAILDLLPVSVFKAAMWNYSVSFSHNNTLEFPEVVLETNPSKLSNHDLIH